MRAIAALPLLFLLASAPGCASSTWCALGGRCPTSTFVRDPGKTTWVSTTSYPNHLPTLYPSNGKRLAHDR